MKRHLLKLKEIIAGHRYGFLLFAFVTAATITGAGCVAFMRVFEFVLARRLDWWSIGPACLVTMPPLVLAAVELTRRVAPFAEGAGIPQTVFAAEHTTPANFD